MQPMGPKVSVVIPAYNSTTVEKAVASVAAQGFRDLEVILVDDASSDDTVARAQASLRRHGLRHKILGQERNGGPARSRNQGVAAASGEYVAFLDADDEWLPGKIVAQVAMMDADPSISLCGCQALLVNEQDEVIEPLFMGLPSRLADGWKRLLWHCYIHTSCVLARRRDLGARPFDPALWVGEDRDLWIRLASRGVVGLVQDVSVRIRVSRDSFMPRNTDHILTCTRPMIERHVRSFGGRLSLRERLLVRGSLSSEIGKHMCRSPKSYMRGAAYILSSIVMGYRPVDGMREVLYRAPLVRDLKARIKSAYLNKLKTQ